MSKIEALYYGEFGELVVNDEGDRLEFSTPRENVAIIDSPADAVNLASALLQWATQNREK